MSDQITWVGHAHAMIRDCTTGADFDDVVEVGTSNGMVCLSIGATRTAVALTPYDACRLIGDLVVAVTGARIAEADAALIAHLDPE